MKKIILSTILLVGLANAYDLKQLRNGCATNYKSCATLGYIYKTGENGIKKNDSLAENFYTLACEKDFDGQGCYGLGSFYEKNMKNKAKAMVAYEKSCKLGFMEGCRGKERALNMKEEKVVSTDTNKTKETNAK